MNNARLFTFDITGIKPEHDEPTPERLISGTPKFRAWNLEELDGRLFAGVWESTPGKWRIAYEEWEYVHIRSGVSVITEDDGKAYTLKAGDSFVIRPGFKGTWEVLETMTKEYVIRL